MERKFGLILFIVVLFCVKMNAQVLESILSGVECNSSFHIHKFEYKKKWKVVVDEEIDYTAKPDNGSGNWNWQLGSNGCSSFMPFWTLQSLNGNFLAKKNKGVKITNMPTSNSDFGETNGLVKVNNSTESSCQKADGSEAKVKVFFKKDDMNNPNGTVPNWFYYWSNAYGSVGSNGLKFFTVDPNTGGVTLGSHSNPVSFNLVFRNDGNYKWVVPAPGTTVNIIYGSTNAGQNWFDFAQMTTVPNSGNVCYPLNFRKVLTGYGNIDFTINIGEGCGYELNATLHDLNTGAYLGSANYTGIEGYVSTLYHELEHWNLKVDLWPNGYDTADDCDKDGYPDSWEANDPLAIVYGFDPSKLDKYNSNYNVLNLQTSGAATWYEEVKCRVCQSAKNFKILNNFDWSFDKTGNYQGKNW